VDNTVLKKKLSTYLSPKGQLRNLNDDILFEVLTAWENWTASSAEFYRSLGFSHKQLASLLGKAKKLKREGRFGTGEFKAVTIEGSSPVVNTDSGPCAGAEIVWTNGRVIRFSQVDLLLDFLKKSA
jgi:hypothetical protein